MPTCQGALLRHSGCWRWVSPANIDSSLPRVEVKTLGTFEDGTIPSLNSPVREARPCGASAHLRGPSLPTWKHSSRPNCPLKQLDSKENTGIFS
ncbi:hypothetical protein FJTKL_03949 [Diaporthe vaccinii]|uniref:Uncharacterized protein n=1 Tax=Diaporthe vaccinii TaxID=105482 RepID=A0ABR4F1M7_9PEZI